MGPLDASRRHDYGHRNPVPLDIMAAQYEIMYDPWEGGRMPGCNILRAMCMDRDPEQAEPIRNFLASH